MSEAEARLFIETELNKTISNFNLVLTKSEYGNRVSEYTATFTAVILEGSVTSQTRKDLKDSIIDGGSEYVKVVGSEIDLETSQETLTIEAEITI